MQPYYKNFFEMSIEYPNFLLDNPTRVPKVSPGQLKGMREISDVTTVGAETN